jgi:outer membrane lipoprotein SlyB
VRRDRLLALLFSLPLSLAACGPSYSPDTYAAGSVQQASKVDQGVVIGRREVSVSTSGGIGAVAGGAAGGIAGAQFGAGAVSALSALGGSLIGGLAGSAAEKVSTDTKAFEYIVRKPNNELISVTQRDEKPLEIGAKVLVIAGAQARIVPDYTTSPAETAAAAKPAESKPVDPAARDAKPIELKPALPAAGKDAAEEV